MRKRIYYIVSLLIISISLYGQENSSEKIIGFRVPAIVYDGDTIPNINLPVVYIFKPLILKNNKQRKEYNRLVRDVKRTLPIAKDINSIIIETYEYLQTLPNEKERQKHLKNVEKDLKHTYTPKMKKLTLNQGKLLIKLVYRETNSSSYELVKAFLGPLRAGSYQVFAWMFGASLKKEYDPTGADVLTERVVLLVENGQL